MSQPISLSIPCLNSPRTDYYQSKERLGLTTRDKVILAVSAFFIALASGLAPHFPVGGGICLIAMGVGLMFATIYKMIHMKFDTQINQLSKLEPAKQLAIGIDVPAALQEELKQIIPFVDARQQDPRVGSLSTGQHETVFRLTTTPHLQFRISTPSSQGTNEIYLANRFN